MITLNEKNVGDVVKIKENGVPVNFIIVQKGLPSDMYDSSCDGVWVLRKTTHSDRPFNNTANNDYENSSINKWLNGEYLNSIDPEICAYIKQVKVPFKKGTGNDPAGVQTGADGLPCKVFFLAGNEIITPAEAENTRFINDGSNLTYFSSTNMRICNNSSNVGTRWRIRTPTGDAKTAYHANPTGGFNANVATDSFGVRPAFVLPYNLLVESDGTVLANTPPTISSDKTGDLGTLESGFTCNYSVNNEGVWDTLTVTLTLDGVQLGQFNAERNKQYSYTLGGDEWLKITEGEHTFKIGASDGYDTVENTVTFSRSIEKAFVSLEAPLEADDAIRVCSLFVKGSLPMDIELLCEVTNNGNDEEPVWEDCTVKVKAGVPYVFKNQTAENGFAFNFRVAAKRGLSDTGGYITEVSGGFE